MRPTREELHMGTAVAWAKRSTCRQPNRQIGVVITSASMDEILAFGYNGPSKNQPNDACTASGNQEQPSRCTCLHAEINAFLKCQRSPAGGFMFVTLSPCLMCAQAIDQAQLKRVYYLTPYRDASGVELLLRLGVKVVHMALS